MRILREEKGSVLVIIAIGMAAFLGMAALVLDGGMQYVTKSKLQNAVDAAALAAAQDLIADDYGVTARQTANTYLGNNGVILAGPGVANADDVSVTFNEPDYTELTVTVTRVVSFNYAVLFGNDDKYQHNNIEATAKVAVYPIKRTTGVLPVGIKEDEFVLGQSFTLWGTTSSPGNFGWLDLDPSDHSGGANDVADWIANGYDGEVWVDEEIYSETGKMSQAITQLNARISECTAGCTHGKIEPNCPRLVVVPIIDEWPAQGQAATTTVIGFAQLLLPANPISWSGNDITFTGTFVGGITNGTVDPDQRDFGLKGVRLIQ